MINSGELRPSTVSSVLHATRQSFYYAPMPPARRLRHDDAEKRHLIGTLAGWNITYGYRRIWVLMKRQGVFISRNRVRRMLKEMGLQKEVHFPRPRLPQTGNLITDVPDTRWYTDITFIDTTDYGNCPFIDVEDSCTREILSWDFLQSCGTMDAFRVVETAVMSRFDSGRAEGLRLKTDGGPQFISTQYREGCSLPGIVLEPIRKRKPEDNGMVEALQGHFKMDYVFISEPMSFVETKLMLGNSVKHYNEKRPHSSLGYGTPSEFRKMKEMEARQ